jgi:hypothetical protein
MLREAQAPVQPTSAPARSLEIALTKRSAIRERAWAQGTEKRSARAVNETPGRDGDQGPELHVDEDWKRAVAEEKERMRGQPQGAAQGDGPRQAVEVTFAGFVAGLYTQTLMALGELEDPRLGRREHRPAEAVLLIDTLAMLKDKTDGNLTDEEADYLQRLLTDLRMRYVDASSRPPGRQEGEEPDEAGQ